MAKPFRIVVLLLMLLSASLAVQAFTVSYSGENTPAKLRWRSPIVQVAVSASLRNESSNIKSESDVSGALIRSLQTWERVADIDLQLTESAKLNVSPAGAGDGVSLITVAQTPENLLLFTKDPGLVSALTRVFFNKRGQITEADIVLNPYQQFSTDGTLGTFDLESVLTHEFGHLLGLDHSPLLGSAMHENYGKNGVYGLQNFSSRTLAAEDVAAIRALYGPLDDDSGCCGRIAGKVLLANGRPARNAEVWIEDAETGGVQGLAATATDGAFHFAAIPAGTYRIFSRKFVDSKLGFPAQLIGKISVDNGDVNAVTKRIGAGKNDVEISYLGFNGQLSELAVPLNAGRSYVIYLGGKNLDPKKITIGLNSPYLSVIPGSVVAHDYGDEISVVSVEVRVDPQTPNGEYSIFVESAKRVRSYVVGGLKVGDSPNPQSVTTIYRN
jgi:hypothetical protein